MASSAAGQEPLDGPQRPFRRLTRHTLIYGSGYVTMAAVSLVLVPVYTHHLSPREFGLLGLMLVLYGLMKQVYDLGFMNSVGRFFFDCKSDDGDGAGELGRMRSTSLAFLAAYGGLMTAALWLFAGEWAQLLTGDSKHGGLVRIVAVTLYAEALAIVPLTLIRMQERSGLYVLITIVRFIVTLLLSVLFVAGLGWGVRGALLGNAIPAMAVLLLLLRDYRLGLRGALSWPLLRQMLAFGLPFFPVLLSGWLIDASDRYLLELFRSREEVGYYSLAYRVGAVMQIGVAAFSMGWAPLRYQIFERPDAPDVYRRLTSYYVLAASFLAVALAVFAGEIIEIVAPPSYAPAAGVVGLIALAYGLYGLYLMMVTGMGVTKKTAPMAWTAALGAAVNIGLNLLVIPPWGMRAAALTTVLAYSIMVAGAWFYSQRVYPIPYDWSRITRIVVIGSVTVAIAALASPTGLLAGLAWALAAWLAFFFALVKTGTIAPDELAQARALLRRREVLG